MAGESGSRRRLPRESFVIWLDRSPHSAAELQGEIERTSTSERMRFESGIRLLEILAASRPRVGASPAERSTDLPEPTARLDREDPS